MNKEHIVEDETMMQSLGGLIQELTEETATILKGNLEVSEMVAANSRTEFSHIAFMYKHFVHNLYVDKVYQAVERDDVRLKKLLGELARLHGDNMEKLITRNALVIAFPPQIN